MLVARCLLIGVALVASGCSRLVFDHSVDAGRDDGGVPRTCAGAKDGTRCDDRDVCTPASTCREQMCVASNAFDSCIVADSAEDFAGEQGEGGWFYGYWDADDDDDASYDSATDFMPMEYCDDNNWRPPGRCALSDDDPDFQWTMNLAWGLQHPDKGPGLELPIRRWVSDVSGPARITAVHHVDGSHGDGTRALLLVDGVQVWRNDAVAGDEVGVEKALDVELELGTIVEQLVHPIDNSGDDTTYFSIKIEGR